MNIESNDHFNIDQILEDLFHPNPNINQEAYLKINRFYPKIVIDLLISNLETDDIYIRRKSALALSSIGEDIILPLCHKYLSTESLIFHMSCLKVLSRTFSIYKIKLDIPELDKVIRLALLDESSEILLTVMPLLRQIGLSYLPLLVDQSKRTNVLRACSAISAMAELDDPLVEKVLLLISEDNHKDILIRNSASDGISRYNQIKSLGK
tara:strand:- start:42 stop:668 length:627 start_codon:yes stop_codon:yes gene_type:complete